MERPRLPIYMKFKTRLSESMMVGVRIGVASKKLGEPVGGGAVCTLDFVLDGRYTGVHTCKKSSCTLKIILLH